MCAAKGSTAVSAPSPCTSFQAKHKDWSRALLKTNVTEVLLNLHNVVADLMDISNGKVAGRVPVVYMFSPTSSGSAIS